jgi:hypothetical protein
VPKVAEKSNPGNSSRIKKKKKKNRYLDLIQRKKEKIEAMQNLVISMLFVMVFMTERSISLNQVSSDLSTLPAEEVELVSALENQETKNSLPVASSFANEVDDAITEPQSKPAVAKRKFDRRPMKISFEEDGSSLCSVNLGYLFWVIACVGCVALAGAFSLFLSDSKAVVLSLLLSGALSLCLTLSVSLSVCLSVSFSGYFGGMLFGCGFGCMAGWLAGVGYGVCQVGPERWVKEKMNSVWLCIQFVSCTL